MSRGIRNTSVRKCNIAIRYAKTHSSNWILRICVVQRLQDFPCENNTPKECHLHVTAPNFTSLTWVLLSPLRKGRNTVQLTSPPTKQKYKHQNEYCWFLGCEALCLVHIYRRFERTCCLRGNWQKCISCKCYTLMLRVELSDLTRIAPNTKREKLCDRRARENPFFLFLLFFEIEGCVLHVRARVLKFNKICKVHTTITVKRVRVAIVALKKQEVIHFMCAFVCVCVALIIQHAKRMRRIILSSAVSLALYFAT